jgi:hypothetical protein
MRQTFMLSQWTVERRGDHWWFGDPYRDDKSQYRGPYSSMTSVALMIARELVKEILRRQARLNATPAE